MFVPSPSKAALAERCEFPWARMAPRWPQRAPGPPALFGSAVGRAAELHVGGQAVDLDVLAAEWKLLPAQITSFKLCARHVLEQVDALKADPEVTDLRAEVPFAYDWRADTGRECGARAPGGKATDQREGEVSGTVDVIYRRRGRLVIRDWKTGVRAREHRPAETLQVIVYALAAVRAHGDGEATIELAHADADGVYVVHDDLDTWALDESALRVRELYERIRTGGDGIVPKPGQHCVDSYCPIVAVCPVTVAAMRAIERAAEAPAIALSTPDQIESPEHAAKVRVRLKMIEEAVKATKQLALEPYVRRTGPIDLGNGKVWGAVQNEGREVVDLAKAGAVGVMKKHLGEFGFDAAVELSTSKSSIHQAAVQVAPKGKASALERALLGELRGIEAMKRGAPYESFEEWVPKKDEPKEAA